MHSKLIWDFKGDMKKMSLALELYFKKMEAAALEVLHSPNDHLGLDYYIDKYRKGHNDMSDQEWHEFHEILTDLKDSKTITLEEKLAAAQLLNTFAVLVALHKLQRVPPELKEKLTKKI